MDVVINTVRLSRLQVPWHAGLMPNANTLATVALRLDSPRQKRPGREPECPTPACARRPCKAPGRAACCSIWAKHRPGKPRSKRPQMLAWARRPAPPTTVLARAALPARDSRRDANTIRRRSRPSMRRVVKPDALVSPRKTGRSPTHVQA